MALSDTGLCAQALVRLGAAPIDNFTDETAESEIAGILYAPVRDGLLAAYPWSFATRQQTLTPLVNAPAGDYARAFRLPNDFLRAISAGTGGRGRGVKYRLAQGELHTNIDSVLLTYIFRPEEADFPAWFDTALIARLAAEFCIPVTENTSRAESLYRLAEQEFARARQIDAQQDTPNRVENFPLIDVRG